MSHWNSDAEFIHDLDPNLIFVNPKIESFLKTHDQFILVASKGMGKTLLLRHRRHLIEQQTPGITLIPHNAVCDFVRLGGVYRKDLVTSMRDYAFWREMWELSIATSSLLNFPHHLTDGEQENAVSELGRAVLPARLLEELKAALCGAFHPNRPPSSVLEMLLSQTLPEIEKCRKSALPVVYQLYMRFVHSACFVFIDSFDQALEMLLPGDLEAWRAGQNGLLTAAWELSRHNPHTKVYVTIRQEAYASFNEIGLNIKGSILLIEYSQQDLKQIFLKAIRHYEGLDSIEAFIGLEQIYNTYIKIYEDPFEYLYRHILPVPRWLMVIGHEISGSRRERGLVAKEDHKARQEQIANIVNNASAMDLAMTYLRVEMKLFFQGTDPVELLEALIQRISSNVLSLAHLQRISEALLSDAAYSGVKHPFCLLFNLGLLGYVNHSAAGVKRRQIFRKPYEFDWQYENILPISPDTYYLLHPSLFHVFGLKNLRFRCNTVRIGQELEWSKADDVRIKREWLRVFVSYAHDDWSVVEKLIGGIEERLTTRGIVNDIWVDRWKMHAGKWVQDQITAGIRESDFLILAISKNSLGSQAVAVEWKTKFADKFNKGIDSVLPIIIDNSDFRDLPDFLSNIFCYKYNGDEMTLERLANDLVFLKQEQSADPLKKRGGDKPDRESKRKRAQ